MKIKKPSSHNVSIKPQEETKKEKSEAKAMSASTFEDSHIKRLI